MIGYLEGKLLLENNDYLLVNVHGVGYQVYVPSTVFNHLPPRGEDVTFYIHTVVREDAITLYGFLTVGELDLFKQLITVSGIGPKVATGMVSALQTSELKKAIVYEDVATLKKIPGIGEKTAKRLILELKNKVDLRIIDEDNQIVKEQTSLGTPAVEEAREALETLGFSRSEAYAAIEHVQEKDDVQVIIREALRTQGRGKS